ncbi:MULTISPECIES: cyclodeaminase [unclassified Modicisalibacter]|uniref:cyclodeaminase n=1 Tax=unclassified Modicisalibacter TaxID=2679913 RepID=UPI001CCEC1DF|nr:MULTISPECIES: cyclodeaminase [unclassified Modicisalibacter]MBZ9559903.1 cyclodeaminase [Modicisalibacter sp. R2A 31.J]MBZ9575811.1 cyclodeaminase [Modicisalibacter sp. MOD 31.J]
MELYQRDDIEAAVRLDREALEAVEQAFAALGRGEVVQPPILSMAIEESNGEVDVKTAHIRGAERFAIKVSPGFFDNPKKGLPSLNGLMMVFSAETGLVDAVLFDEGYLTAIRTALAGALAAKYLSREASRRVAVLGAGEQAELQIRALQLVRDIDTVDVWARNRESAEAYAERVRGLGLTVNVHDDVRGACASADIIVTATPAREPILSAQDLPEGVHVTAMGSDSPEKRELDDQVMVRADAFVCDTRPQSESNGELKAFVKADGREASVPFKVYELGRVIADEQRLRVSDASITVCDLTGTGVQDTAIANFALQRLVK